MKVFKIIAAVLVAVLVSLAFNHYAAAAGVVMGALIFTAPGGVATPFAFNMNYLPANLIFNNVVPLTSLRVTTAEDGVLHDYVAASIAAINGYMLSGGLPANNILLRIANGQLKRNVTISGVTSAAGAIGFYENSDQIGSMPYKVVAAQILAQNPTEFTAFTAVWVPTMAAVTDICEVTYRSGLVQNYNINDLQALSASFQETPQIMINNINGYISKVRFTTAANQTAYILNYKLS